MALRAIDQCEKERQKERKKEKSGKKSRESATAENVE